MTSKKSDLERNIPVAAANARNRESISSREKLARRARDQRSEDSRQTREANAFQKDIDRREKREIAEENNLAKTEVQKLKNEHSLEYLEKEVELKPRILKMDFDDWFDRENILRQGKIMDSNLNKSEMSHSAILELIRMTLEHVYKLQLSGSTPSDKPVISPEQLETIRQHILSPAPSNEPLKNITEPAREEKPGEGRKSLTLEQKFVKGD